MATYKDILTSQSRRAFKVIAKRFLVLLEDLQNEHIHQFDKLRANLPPEYHTLLNQADYFDTDKFTYLRKKTLDAAGEAERDYGQDLEQYDIRLN